MSAVEKCIVLLCVALCLVTRVTPQCQSAPCNTDEENESGESDSEEEFVDRTPPTADASCPSGPVLQSAGTLTLSDRASTDCIGVTTFMWTLQSGPTSVTPFTQNTATGDITFTDITVWQPLSPYTFRLTVTDAAGNTDWVTCTVYFIDDLAPTAVINCPTSDVVTTTTTDMLILDASGSSDLAATIGTGLHYDWTIITEGSVPLVTVDAGSTLTITNIYQLEKLVDYVVELEVVDPSHNHATATCTFQVAIVCGDGMKDGTEECDDGNSVDNDGCSNSCTVNAANCQDLADIGQTTSGVFTIVPCGGGTPIEVFCDFDTVANEGWLVVQKRCDGSENFDRDLTDYADGFGAANDTEFWLGLDNIYAITSDASCSGTYEIRFDMQAFAVGVNAPETAYEEYSSFSITDSTNDYTLSISGPAGTAGDSMLSFHHGQPFIADDGDDNNNDCNDQYFGGWWYKNCHQANPNGLWGETQQEHGEGINWLTWKGYKVSLEKIQMAVKPA